MLKYFLLFLSLLSACSNKSFYKESKIFMDTIFTITLPYKNKNIINDIFKIIEANENNYFSVFKASSETYKINQLLKDCKNKYIDIEISDKLKNILEYSKLYNKETEGAFSVNFKLISDYWITSLKNQTIPDDLKLKKLLASINNEAYSIKNNTLTANCGLSFGFGAIAKGYTLEELHQYLIKNGIKDFLIDAGGDIISSGNKNKKAWKISVLNPNNKNTPYAICSFKDEKMAILSSASYYRYTELNGVKYSHIIDLKTAKPSDSGIVSISIISHNAILADAFATALYTEAYNMILSNFDNYYNKELGIILSTEDNTYLNTIAKKYCYKNI